MTAIYTYLISSLPMLQFGGKSAFSLERFLGMCRALVPEKDFSILELCVLEISLEHGSVQPTLKKWLLFEVGLRNELVKIRASRKKIEPAKYLRQGGSGEGALYHIAIRSHRISSPLDAELFLDRERWNKLEELSLGHYFDLDTLIIYCLKLRILWRWENIGRRTQEELLDRASAPSGKKGQ